MNGLDKVIDAFARLFLVLVQVLGKTGAVLAVLGVVLLFFGWKAYAAKKAVQGWREALAEKERSIQRLANTERGYRIETLIRQGMRLEDAERLIIGASQPTGSNALLPVRAKKWYQLGK